MALLCRCASKTTNKQNLKVPVKNILLVNMLSSFTMGRCKSKQCFFHRTLFQEVYWPFLFTISVNDLTKVKVWSLICRVEHTYPGPLVGEQKMTSGDFRWSNSLCFIILSWHVCTLTNIILTEVTVQLFWIIPSVLPTQTASNYLMLHQQLQENNAVDPVL